MTLKPEDRALALALERFPDEVTHDYDTPPGVPKHPAGKIVTDRGDLRFAFVAGFKAAREESHPDPRPSPVGREEVARWICRTVRIAQGFKGTAEYTLDDEVHNAWDDWLDEADDLLALFFPADGWRLVPEEPTEMMLRAGYEVYHGPDETTAGGFMRLVTWEEACEAPGFREGWVKVHRAMLAAAPPPPGGQG